MTDDWLSVFELYITLPEVQATAAVAVEHCEELLNKNLGDASGKKKAECVEDLLLAQLLPAL